MAAIDELIKNYELEPRKEEEYTQKILEALQVGQKFKFIVSLQMPPFEPPRLDPDSFPSRKEYRQCLSDMRKKFVQEHTEKFYHDVKQLGINPPPEQGLLSIICLEMDLAQYDAVKKHSLVARLTADHPAWNRQLMIFNG